MKCNTRNKQMKFYMQIELCCKNSYQDEKAVKRINVFDALNALLMNTCTMCVSISVFVC